MIASFLPRLETPAIIIWTQESRLVFTQQHLLFTSNFRKASTGSTPQDGDRVIA
jgi:hypothetical protein